MKSYDIYEIAYEKRATSHAWEHHPDAEPGKASGPYPSSASDAAPDQASQSERSVMHPDRHDLEWRYCRGSWAG